MDTIKIYDNKLTPELREKFDILYHELKDLDYRDRIKKSNEISYLQKLIIDNKNQNYLNFCKILFEKDPFFTPVTITFILDRETEDCIKKLQLLLLDNEKEF